jgi:gliding motility-associated lipoprotein GldH
MRIFLLVFICLTLIVGCDEKRVYEANKSIDPSGWYYNNRLSFEVPIDNADEIYNFYINVRVKNTFKYSNVFFMLHTYNIDGYTSSERIEITLTDDAGRFTGNGLGDIFSYSKLVKKQFKFNENGVYRFELEQNMRDDTLLHVVSAGIRIEKAN